jgi:hypothetical protein
VVRTVQGDVLKPASLDAAVEGRDAVICVLGTPSPRRASSLLEDGTRNLIEAMKRARVPRLVCVTLLGTADSKRNASPLYRSVIVRALAPMVPDKGTRSASCVASVASSGCWYDPHGSSTVAVDSRA